MPQMNDYYSLQVGDEYYYPIGHHPLKINTWTVEQIPTSPQGGTTYVRRDFDKVRSAISLPNWMSLVAKGNIVTKKYLIDMVGEEELFQHILADTLKDLLLIAKIQMIEEGKDTIRKGIMR